MDKLSVHSLKRNPELVKSFFKNVGETVVTTKTIRVLFPERYMNRELVFMGNTIRLLSIYAVLDDENNYAIVCAPIFQELSPNNVTDLLVDDNVYKVLHFDANDVFMPTRVLVKQDSFIYDIFDEFFIKGNIPWFLSYEDVSNLLVESKKYADSNVGNNPLTMEIITSIIARHKDDKTIRIRETIETNLDKAKADPVYIGLNNIYYAFDNTGARIIGGYYGYGVTNAIMDPETKTTLVADLLRA
jgi:hypothetical protein